MESSLNRYLTSEILTYHNFNYLSNLSGEVFDILFFQIDISIEPMSIYYPFKITCLYNSGYTNKSFE